MVSQSTHRINKGEEKFERIKLEKRARATRINLKRKAPVQTEI